MKSGYHFNSTSSVILVFSLLFFGSAGHGWAQSYWDALLELGFNQTDGKINPMVACQRIEKIHQWKARVANYLQTDKDLLSKIRGLDARMTSLDAGNLYDLAIYSDPGGNWRGVGIRGVSDSKMYRLTLADPQIGNWLAADRDPRTWLRGRQRRFGDIGLRVFIKPAAEDTYKYISEGYFFLEELPFANLVRVLDHVLANIWEYSFKAENRGVDRSLLRSPDTAGLNVLSGFAEDFPNLFEFVCSYFEIEVAISSIPAGSKEWFGIDFTLRGNRTALKADYPSIWLFLKLIEGTLSANTRVLNEWGQMIAAAAFDSGTDFYHWRVSVMNNRLGQALAGEGPKKAGAFSLIDKDFSRITVFQDITVDVLGLQITVKDLEMALAYAYKDSGPRLTIRLVQPPKAVGAGGLALNMIPIWLVDLLIPSSVEEIIADFFEVLAMSNEGKGAMLELGSFANQSQGETLWIRTASDVLANGTIKLGFNLQSQLFARQEGLMGEAAAFRDKLWAAFDLDFSRARSQGWCR